MANKGCDFCGAIWHTRAFCPKIPKPPIKRTPIKSRGKHYTKWIITRSMWFKRNKADYYVCYLCGKSMTKQDTTLDHVIPKSRAPELRYDWNNLKPCCYPCNFKKGSKVYIDPPLPT